MANGFVVPAESPQIHPQRGDLHVREDGGSKEAASPHTATGATTDDGEHKQQRVLAVKLDLRDNDAVYQRLKELSWQAARYRNLFLRAKWAEAKSLCVDPTKNIPHDVTKWIRRDEKMELSSFAYSAAENEVKAVWMRHGKRILAGAPLPEWKPTAALTIKGSNISAGDSGVRLSVDDDGKWMAHLAVQSDKCDGGCWLKIPIASGTVKDYQSELIEQMVEWGVPISKAMIVIKPFRHQVILRMCYALSSPLPRFGNRVATLGPITANGRLCLRTECDTRDFSGRLHTLLDRKDSWDLIRRRAMAQIGRSKGSARKKRQLLARLSWDDWLTTFLHTWSREIIDWLHGQGVARLSLQGLNAADWPAFKFTQMLKYKGEAVGIDVNEEADLEDAATQRAVKTELQRQRRQATKAGKAIRELIHQKGN